MCVGSVGGEDGGGSTGHSGLMIINRRWGHVCDSGSSIMALSNWSSRDLSGLAA